MTSPVTADNLVQGAVKWLSGFDDVIGVLGVFSDTGTPWLFQHSLQTVVENSQSTAAVVSRAGGWAGGNEHNTLRFPRLSLEIYVDPPRDAGNNITDPGEAQRRLDAVFDIFDWHLHRPASTTVMWGSVRTITCVRSGEPSVFPLAQGILRLQALYNVAQG